MEKFLPTGFSDYKKFIESGFDYIDKTLFIKELLSRGPGLRLICRPRRFGKTMNLSMLRYFFEKTEKSNAHLFINKAIWQHEECRAVQGQYPVVFLTFKDVKEESWEAAYKKCVSLIADEYKRHQSFIEANASLINHNDLEIFNKVAEKKGDYTELSESIKFLTHLLHTITDKNVILLIDEYDAPIHAAQEHGYYKEMVSLIRGMFSAALKDNANVEAAVLTGILRTSKEGIFSGLNNLNVYTLLNDKFADKFGFLSHEVDALIKRQNIALDSETIKQWYNGYRAGTDTLLYNPWSIIHCIENNGALKPYWANTSNNDLIKKLIISSSAIIKTELEAVLVGDRPITKRIDDAFVFPGIERNSDALWSLLLFSGYITFFRPSASPEKTEECTLIIPNKEIKELYERMLKDIFTQVLGTTQIITLFDALCNKDAETVEEILQKLIGNSISYYDFSPDEPEQSYHLFFLGLLVSFSDTYHIRSNRESGSGRYDLMLIPKDKKNPGIIFELKVAKSDSTTHLEAALKEALKQIEKKAYRQELMAQNIDTIIEYAIACFGKKLMIQVI